MTQLATVYERRGDLFVLGMSRTSLGVWIATSWNKLDPDDDVSIGRAVLDAVANSVEGIEHPSLDAIERLNEPLLRLANVRSIEEFNVGTRGVEVERGSDGSIHVIPLKNVGASEGFQSLDAEEIALSETGDLADLGAVVRGAL